MRALLLVIAVLGVSAAPTAWAHHEPGAPLAIASFRAEGQTILTWTTVEGAADYIVFAGESSMTLAPIGTTSLTFFTTAHNDTSVLAVAARTAAGEVGAKAEVSSGGNCIATSNGLSIAVSLSSCLGTALP